MSVTIISSANRKLSWLRIWQWQHLFLHKTISWAEPNVVPVFIGWTRHHGYPDNGPPACSPQSPCFECKRMDEPGRIVLRLGDRVRWLVNLQAASWQDLGRYGLHPGAAGPQRRPPSIPLGVCECGTASAPGNSGFKHHDVQMHGLCQDVPNQPRWPLRVCLLGYVATGERRMLGIVMS